MKSKLNHFIQFLTKKYVSIRTWNFSKKENTLDYIVILIALLRA